jgi:hypothetical protein
LRIPRSYIVESRAVSYGYVPPPPRVGPPLGSPPPALQRRSSSKILWIIFGAVLGGGVLIAFFVFAIMAAVFGALRSSEPYHHSIEVATHDRRVIAALGSPIRPGWLPSGSFNVNGASGDATLEIGLDGTAHRGTVFVIAHRSEGVWSYQNLAVRVEETGQRIDLLTTGIREELH